VLGSCDEAPASGPRQARGCTASGHAARASCSKGVQLRGGGRRAGGRRAQVADLVKLDRLNRLNRLVNEVAEERAQRFLGRPLEARACPNPTLKLISPESHRQRGGRGARAALPRLAARGARPPPRPRRRRPAGGPGGGAGPALGSALTRAAPLRTASRKTPSACSIVSCLCRPVVERRPGACTIACLAARGAHLRGRCVDGTGAGSRVLPCLTPADLSRLGCAGGAHGGAARAARGL
jgi:hypothetical protein